MAKSTENKKETRTEIFQASAKLFALRGYEGASMRQIAKEAEVNLALINYHFNDKHQLYREVIDHGLSLWGQLLEAYRGCSLEKILIKLMKHTTDKNGSAYYMSIIMRMFIDSSTSKEHRANMLEFGPPNSEVIQEAVAKKIGREGIDQDTRVITHFLLYNLIMGSRVKFGTSAEEQQSSTVTKLFPGCDDPYTQQLLELAEGLCARYSKK